MRLDISFEDLINLLSVLEGQNDEYYVEPKMYQKVRECARRAYGREGFKCDGEYLWRGKDKTEIGHACFCFNDRCPLFSQRMQQERESAALHAIK